MRAYDIGKRVLRESSDGVGPKHGILILGAANVGKTRLALEALIQTLPDWNVFLWNSTYNSLSKVPLLTISRRSGLVIFIDDLQEYVPPENCNTDGSVFIPDNRIATLQAFLNNMLMTRHLVVVATCRLEDEIRVGARLRWLFEQLEIITLRNFRVETSNPETANIINLFQQHGSAHIEDWDGTLGSLVLGLSKKRSQYEDLVQSHNPTVIVLRAMKLLSFAFITVHTTVRIQGVCTDVFGESTLKEGSQTWQDAIDLLTRLEFLSEVKDQANGGFVLVIRKDAYFDKVIIDYPVTNRPYQLDQHFEQLQKVLVRLHDISALVNLANMFSFLKRYDEALVTVEEAIRLDPNYAVAYNDKGVILSTLRRNDEALISYEEALRLDSSGAHTYSNKGNALVNLKRYDEALVAFEEAIRLNPNYAAAYLGMGSAFGIHKQYDEALVAFEEAISLNPNYAAAYNNKASALASLNLHEEALAACEEAIRLAFISRVGDGIPSSSHQHGGSWYPSGKRWRSVVPGCASRCNGWWFLTWSGVRAMRCSLRSMSTSWLMEETHWRFHLFWHVMGSTRGIGASRSGAGLRIS
jgi:tetratricopeptide (TPR) repeat protein